MTTYKTNCFICGPVDVPQHDIRLVLRQWAQSWYVAACPICSQVFQHPADNGCISIMVTSGVKVVRFDPPEQHDGKAFDYDDLLEFGLELGVVDVVAACGGPA